MTTAGRLELVAFDAADIERVAAFYRELTGWQVVRRITDWITLQAPDGQEIAFQLVPEHRPPSWPGQERPQQVHLDLLVDDHQAAAARALALGATHLADGPTWITLADPAGHPIDLCQKDGHGPGVSLFAVTFDTPSAAGSARFYSALLGMEVTYDGPEGLLISGYGKRLMFQEVAGYTAPRWPDPAHPQQAHLDILVDDLEAGHALALELGATLLDGDSDQFRTFADPVGHPFDLTL
ncbi:VOC family protein [Nonomuraea sp. NPDC050310]|uniref:VOC family protein n=1 Tax=unclassified Nonomuraea TaxID=2593643 RepID=UPI0033C70EC4